ncbi:hypothetical protein WJU16_16805 [Chitinophaga pollutisoli]|uniref:Heparinase II C-terminal domain-containing protein n=1 Tax=Chitinophaga pollutisoli TaxID=3133966 RepID=A0ABZ2YIY4_9BACT
MKLKTGVVIGVLLNFVSMTVFAQAYPAVVGDKYVNRQPAHRAKLNGQSVSVVNTADGKGKLVGLKKDVKTARPADLTFTVKVPARGLYELSTWAVPEKEGTPATAAHVKIQIGDRRPTTRILFDAYHGNHQIAGKFDMEAKEEKVKIWLPEGVRLGYIEWKNANDPAIPEKAQRYTPGITPPAGHPRIWVTPQSLPLVKSRLMQGENKAAWDKVHAAAIVPFRFDFNPDEEIFYREDVEKAVETKAFYYLMTGDKTVGREASKLMADYLSVLEFGNVTYGDITREIGRSIYVAALVYDWCYDLLSESDRRNLRFHMLRLARDMEIGWPPFMDSIINGHGNEAQISRDLLAMAIAMYDEDPLPYKYTAYTVLEELVPMRKFEYESPRHNQGVDYGAYRLMWEMHAVWLFYRMTGHPVFDDNIKHLPYYWLYMRLPDGYMLRDGDMFSVKGGTNAPLYWKQPMAMLLSYAYANDPLLKAEFQRQGGLPDNPVLFLLVNDPALPADHDLTKLPLTKDFGKVLGGVVARTGWNNSPESKDVIAEIKGGGYHFANHQHADAGGLQIYHHGIQVGDIGLYLSYGTPYDFNFNKRSIAHSMMLAVDPNEKLRFRTKLQDGGTRFNQRFPQSMEETTTDPWFDNGKVMSGAYGPLAQKPAFSYFKADLTGAYSSKMSQYARGFLFLNLFREDVPAIIILTDDMTTADPSFKKYWQINTLQQPQTTGDTWVLRNALKGLEGNTHVQMLVPAAGARKLEVLAGADANSTFGNRFEVKSTKPEASAYRMMVTPVEARDRDKFLTVFQMAEGDAKPLPLQFREDNGMYQLTVADRVVCMSANAADADAAFTVEVPAGASWQVVLAGLKPGFWNIRQEGGTVHFNTDVVAGNNTVHFTAGAGKYVVSPGRAYGAKDVE